MRSENEQLKERVSTSFISLKRPEWLYHGYKSFITSTVLTYMLQIAELQRRVQDLTTMNEMLLEQNAQYRQNNRNQSTPATPIQPMPVTQPIPPHVSF